MRDDSDSLEFASTDVIAWDYDWLENRFVYISDTVEALFGYPVEDWLQADFWPSTIHPEDKERALEFCKQQTESRRDHEFRYRMIHADGSTRWVHDVVTIAKDDAKGRLMLRGVFFDVTSYHEREEALKAAKAQAEEANRAKTEFLGVISHELRTPLNPILGYSELLIDDTLTQNQHESLKAIHDSAKRQLHLIDSLLEYTRLDSQTVSIKHDRFELRPVCQQLLKEAQQTNSSNQIDLKHYTLDGYKAVEVDTWLQTDKGMLEQVLSNLLTNASKYTDNGKIDLFLGHRSTGAGTELYFGIQDTGIGIPKEKCTDLFEPFSRVDTSYRRIHEGIGLGLSITQKLVAILGGEIGFSSQLGEGSYFWLTLPVQESRSEQKAPATDSSNTAVKFNNGAPISLVIEDDALNRSILVKILESAKHEVCAVEDAESALDCCRQHSFDYIFLDLSLPKMDGFEFFQALNQAANNHPSVIATTAHTDISVRTKCKNLGMQGFIAKPMSSTDVKNELARVQT